jgi:hypothetical protein
VGQVAPAGQVTVVNRVDPEDQAVAATEVTAGTAVTAAMARAALVSQAVLVDLVGPAAPVSRVVRVGMIPVDPVGRPRAPNPVVRVDPGRPAAPNPVVRVDPASREATDPSLGRALQAGRMPARPVRTPMRLHPTAARRLPMPAPLHPTRADHRTPVDRRRDRIARAVATCRLAATRAAAIRAEATQAAGATHKAHVIDSRQLSTQVRVAANLGSHGFASQYGTESYRREEVTSRKRLRP